MNIESEMETPKSPSGSLTPGDIQFVLSRIPRDVVNLLKSKDIVLAGGYIRDAITGDRPSDIDLFGYGTNAGEELLSAMGALSAIWGAKAHKSENAYTLRNGYRTPVQFITKWAYETPLKVAESFDFTICQAIIWYDKHARAFTSITSDRFYSDLAARRLYYTNPIRDEAAGGSLLRVLKMVKRGYNIQPESLGNVVARLAMGVRGIYPECDGRPLGLILGGLIREVDPLLLTDGDEPLGEEAPREGGV